MRAPALARALYLGLLCAWLEWACGATCLRDSDCDEGLVCSRDRCVLPSPRGADAGPGEGSAGSASAAGASSGGAGGRPPLPSSSASGSAGRSAAVAAGGPATGGRENLDASVDADAASNRN